MVIPKKRVAIVGAGFGGLSAARILARCSELEVHIIDRRNHHLFQPLLYQVAMAGLNPSEIAIPIRKLFSKQKNVIVTLAEVEDVDVQAKRVYYDKKWKQYDYLILCCGAKHYYFNHDEWEPVAPGLKNIEQATEIRRRILTAFEMAEKEIDPQLQKSYLTFAIVGGGPTGVELAGAIMEMAKNTLKHDYQVADLSQTQVFLIEAGSRVLSAFPETLSFRAQADLKELGVQIIKNTRASGLSTDGLQAGEKWIPCKTIVWAAGVKPSSLTEKIQSEKDHQGRVIVEPDLSLRSHPDVFVIGDIAAVKNSKGEILPGIAPVAIQEGEFVGRLICDEILGKKRKVFSYFDKGIMATIGRSRAVVSADSIRISGTLAWIAWVLIHVIYLMQFRNRVFVFFQWVWSYFRFGHGARLIVHKTWRFYSGQKIHYDND